MKALRGDVEVINEPQREGSNALDLVVLRNLQSLGYIECKNLPVTLDDVSDEEQLRRYREACDNLILTNYGEFRWYRGGKPAGNPVTVAHLSNGKIQSFNKRYDELETLLQRFLYTTPSEITSPKELVTVMAILTREISERISTVLDSPDDQSFLHKHRRDLEVELLPKLVTVEFADMYAQTLTFALFVARVHHLGRPEEFTLRNAFFDMPTSNPFLHGEFRTIVNQLDANVKWAVNQLVQVFALTKIDEVLEGFGSRSKRRDPVIHFYEDFLIAYNPDERKRRGVYFTPDPGCRLHRSQCGRASAQTLPAPGWPC